MFSLLSIDAMKSRELFPAFSECKRENIYLYIYVYVYNCVYYNFVRVHANMRGSATIHIHLSSASIALKSWLRAYPTQKSIFLLLYINSNKEFPLRLVLPMLRVCECVLHFIFYTLAFLYIICTYIYKSICIILRLFVLPCF